MKRLLLATTLTILTNAASADAISPTQFLYTSFYTTNTDPAVIGLYMNAVARLDFQPDFTTSGTFTLANDVTYMSIFPGAGVVLASSQMPSGIDLNSFVTFDQGRIIDWSISGAAPDVTAQTTPQLDFFSVWQCLCHGNGPWHLVVSS